jgi:hypothetical protein
VIAGFHLADSRETAWAEWYRQLAELGLRLYAEGWRSILAPSAARPGPGRILCLFREEQTIAGVKPVPPPAIYRHPPAPPADA